MRGNKTLKPKKKNIRKMRISSKRNKQNTKKYKKIRNRKKRVSRKVGGMTGDYDNNSRGAASNKLPGSSSRSSSRRAIEVDVNSREAASNNLPDSSSRSSSSRAIEVDVNSRGAASNNLPDSSSRSSSSRAIEVDVACAEEVQASESSTKKMTPDQVISFLRVEDKEQERLKHTSEPVFDRKAMKDALEKGTKVYLTYNVIENAIDDPKTMYTYAHVFLQEIFSSNKTLDLKQQMKIAKELISSFYSDATEVYNEKILETIIKEKGIDKSSQTLLASHLNTIINRSNAREIAGIKYDVAQACLEIANRAKDPKVKWLELQHDLRKEQDNKIELLKGYIKSKYIEKRKEFPLDLDNWSLEKIYAYVLCAIGVAYLAYDPLRGYFIISLSNVGHHILRKNNEEVTTASLPSFMRLCMDLVIIHIEKTGQKISMYMYQLFNKLLKYIENNNEIQGFMNMTAFTSKYTLKILEFICNSGKRGHDHPAGPYFNLLDHYLEMENSKQAADRGYKSE